MKKHYSIFILAILFLSGCGDKTVTGPQGPQGNPGPNTIQISFQNSLFPAGSYAGETDTWLSRQNPSTTEFSMTYRQISVGSTETNYSRELLKFDVGALPVNATIETVRLLLTTISSSSVGSSPITIGLHDMNPALLSDGCTWTTAADWSSYDGSTDLWSDCDGDATTGDKGMYTSPALSTAVLDSTYSGTTKVIEFSIPASIVSNWVSGTNNGLILVSEGEFASVSSANVDFYPYNAATATDRPQLIVTYE